MNPTELFEKCLMIIQEYDEKGYVINRNGMTEKKCKEHPITNDELQKCLPEIRKALTLIPLLVRTTSAKSMVNTYSLKHVIEDTIYPGYISNGECILALIILKYRIKHIADSFNCRVYCKYVDSDYLPKYGGRHLEYKWE